MNVVKDEIDTEIEILGSRWNIYFVSQDEDPGLKEGECFGYAEDCDCKIVIQKRSESDDPLAIGLKAQEINQKRVLRHELIHAFLSESGLADSSRAVDAWAVNEEMVDWFARMSPRIFSLYKELGLVQC